MFSDKVLYDVLDIPMNATMQSIREAYLGKLRECDPKQVSSLDEEIQELARQKKKALDGAYEVLADAARREEYDRWILNNSQLKVTPDGRVIRKQKEQKIDLSAAELAEILEDVIIKLKEQIFSVDDAISWKEGSKEGFDVYIEGKMDIDRYYIYVITVDTLQAVDIENLIANTEHLKPGKGLLLHKNYSLFMVLCLDNSADEATREAILQFNQGNLGKRGAASADKTMLALLNLKQQDFYFPYVTGFKPDFQGIKLPKGYSLTK